MLAVFGIGAISAGVLVALYGDMTVSEREGRVGKMVAWPAGRAKWLKVMIGLALIYAGVMLLTHWP